MSLDAVLEFLTLTWTKSDQIWVKLPSRVDLAAVERYTVGPKWLWMYFSLYKCSWS